MSRSYKHTPRSGDNKSNGFKQIFNRKERRYLIQEEDRVTNSRSEYKKHNCSWDICDYQRIESFEEYWKHELEYYRLKGFKYGNKPSRKESYKEWYKYYKMK